MHQGWWWMVGLLGGATEALESVPTCDPSRFESTPLLDPDMSALGMDVYAAVCFIQTRDAAKLACANELRATYSTSPDSGVSVSRTSVEEQWPTQPADYPTTKMIRGRERPKDGVRERTHGLEVRTVCDAGACVDGLYDTAEEGDERRLIAPALANGEFGPDDFVERAIHITAATDEYVSVYIATVSYSPGAAHANNTLLCSTFRRGWSTYGLGSTYDLAEEWGNTVYARRLLRAAAGIDARDDGAEYTLRPESFLLETDGTPTFCASPSFPLSGTVLAVRVGN